ncbi:MAG: response regulator [Candidatus Hodarchaeota archaeon]
MSKILIVDDDYAIRFLYEEDLTEEGYEVITLAGWQGLLETVAQERPDLIILDAKIGEHDGLKVLQDIRTAYYDLPVVLCTAYPVSKYDPRCVAADFFIEKSSDLTGLKNNIKMALENRKQFKVTGNRTKAQNRKMTPIEQIRLDW